MRTTRTVALFLSLLGARVGVACTGPSDLHAVHDGSGVRLTWTGALDPGEQWVLYNADLTPFVSGPGPGDVAYSGTANDFFHATRNETFYRVRCEGGMTPGPWSNMAFWFERDHEAPAGRTSLYITSFPLRHDLGDVSNAAAGASSPCTEDVGGPSMPDGVINADDLLCRYWSSRWESLSVGRWDEQSCLFDTRTAFTFCGLVGFTGPWTGTLNPHEAVLFHLPPPLFPVSNPGSIVGSHDPAMPPRPIELPKSGCVSARLLLSVPYHVRYRSADEILCGEEGVAWEDTNPPDGVPDSCPTGIDGRGGIFDGVNQVSIVSWDRTQSVYRHRAILSFLGGTIHSVGDNFRLEPGDGYLVVLSPGHVATQYRPPVH